MTENTDILNKYTCSYFLKNVYHQKLRLPGEARIDFSKKSSY